jgi:putative phosphoribosyl transferase
MQIGAIRERAALRRFFRDRADAGRQLAKALQRFSNAEPIVLALPRGGVPVAFEVAKALNAPLDVLLVRKIGVPGHEELALGAVVDGANPQTVLNEEVVQLAAPPIGYIEAESRRQLAEIERRRQLYRAGEGERDVSGRTVIVVDDGIATGATVKAALLGIARSKPRQLVLAIPVGPLEAIDDLASACDEIVCLHSPQRFYAVGAYYADFSQTSDDEVVRLLARSRTEAGSS